jgi:hypothetical protein
MENGLILMGDLPRKNGLIVMGDLPKWKMMVLLWWVTYPDVREKDFRKGSQYLETCPFYFLFLFLFLLKKLHVFAREWSQNRMTFLFQKF